MISVIVPIYNAKSTLRRCVDSVLRQTEPDLEVFLIDDGSEDGSGAIADAYRRDPRVRVFHKENGGLSSARNNGLDRANGDYVAFVDVDDWIEPETFETALRYCEDICVFGRAYVYPGKSKQWKPVEAPETIDREEALRRLIIDSSIGQKAWNKLYRRRLFDGVRFPDGFQFEDVRTTYRLLQKADRIALIPNVLYHYVQYRDSIAHVRSAKNQMDRWIAYRELYRVFAGKGEEYKAQCIQKCAHAVFWAWGTQWKADSRDEEQIREITAFARRHRKERLRLSCKTTLLLAATGTKTSMFLMRSNSLRAQMCDLM